ncbi:MAG: Choline/ethanolamine kinase [Anaerospora sp.]|nr:Choline/ethanolamine kinase [Anaerospora sp.]
MRIETVVQEKLRTVFKDESIVFDKSRFAGGLTNYNYIMDIAGIEYVIRQPGGMTEQIIDRKQEKVNNNIASACGVNSNCIYFDEDSGIKISTYITNSQNMAAADPGSPKNLEALHGDLFFDYQPLKNQLVNFVQENIKSTILVPCHNDTVPENFIIDHADKTYLIDWEYSGMNDPCWDVAAYILESKLSDDAIQFLIQAYFGHPLTPVEELKLKSFMMAQDLLWTAWALIRHYNGDDFLEYCKSIIAMFSC